MNKISRKGFLKIAAAAAMSGVTAGALAACNSASSSTASGAAGQYIPGTYEGTAEGILHRQGHHDLLRQCCHRRGGGHLR